MNVRERAEELGRQFDADVFDVEEALYWHCANFHEGQWSERYSILSTSKFKPSPLSNGPDGVVSQLIYDALAEEA